MKKHSNCIYCQNTVSRERVTVADPSPQIYDIGGSGNLELEP